MSPWMEDLLRLLARNPNLGLLVSALLTSAAVACVAGAVALQLQRRSARARSVVWRIAIVALLVVAVWRLLPESAPPVAVMEWRVQLPVATIDETAVLPESPALVLPEKSRWQRGLLLLEASSIRLWLGVALALLGWRVLTAWAGLFWMKRHSEPAQEVVLRALQKMNAPERLSCRVAERLHSPMLSGWRRPVIWLPKDAATWDEARLGAVLRHELAHLQRGDVAWHWLAQLTVCLWWWQPLVWRAWRSLRAETEHAADDAAVLAGGNTQEYARTLVEIAAGLPSRMRKMPGVTMFGGESVQRRVRELMKASQWRGRIGIGAMSLIALVAVILAVLTATKVEFKPKVPVYQSEAKLVSGLSQDAGVNWQERNADFYGTILETLESEEMKSRALERTRALNPKLEEKPVEIHATQIKGSTMFRVQALCENGKYARIFLDALLDEFIAFRQLIREQAGGRGAQKRAEEAVKAQKTMEDSVSRLNEFKAANNILTITNGNNLAAQFLGKLNSQLEEQNMMLADQELTLRNIPSAMTLAQTRVSDVKPLTQTEKDYVQTQSELRRVENELKYLLETHKPDDALVVEAREKTEKARFLLNALVEPLRKEMTERAEDLRRRVTILKSQIAMKAEEALYLGSKIAHYDKLERKAKADREAYEKLYEQVNSYAGLVGSTDFVAIQERAKPATEVMQSGLIPIWRLWTSGQKTTAEETPMKPETKKKEPAKSAD